MPKFEKVAVMGQAETIAALKKLIEQAKAGELNCIAFRVFNADGTWEDKVAGGTPEQQAEALAKLREQH